MPPDNPISFPSSFHMCTHQDFLLEKTEGNFVDVFSVLNYSD